MSTISIVVIKAKSNYLNYLHTLLSYMDFHLVIHLLLRISKSAFAGTIQILLLHHLVQILHHQHVMDKYVIELGTSILIIYLHLMGNFTYMMVENHYDIGLNEIPVKVAMKMLSLIQNVILRYNP